MMIFEPQTEGHHAQYLKVTAEELIERGYMVTLVTFSSCCEDLIVRSLSNKFKGRFQVAFFRNESFWQACLKFPFQFKNEFIYYYLFKEFYKNLPESKKPSNIFLPFINNIARLISLVGSPFKDASFSGLTMVFSFHHHKMGVLRKRHLGDRINKIMFLRMLRLKELEFLFTIDITLKKYIQEYYSDLNNKVVYVNDPAIINGEGDRNFIRSKYNIKLKDRIILVYGLLKRKKGIKWLIDSMKHEDFPKNTKIILAGIQKKEIRKILLTEEVKTYIKIGKIIEINEYVSEELEYQLYKASDIVWLGYQDFYG